QYLQSHSSNINHNNVKSPPTRRSSEHHVTQHRASWRKQRLVPTEDKGTGTRTLRILLGRMLLGACLVTLLWLGYRLIVLQPTNEDRKRKRLKSRHEWMTYTVFIIHIDM